MDQFCPKLSDAHNRPEKEILIEKNKNPNSISKWYNWTLLGLHCPVAYAVLYSMRKHKHVYQKIKNVPSQRQCFNHMRTSSQNNNIGCT